MMSSASPVAMPYPARSIRAVIVERSTSAGSKTTVARSEERFTTASCTPACFFKPRSTVATQFAQVMPVMGRVKCLVSDMGIIRIG
ncbi:MAG: hypothetical protein BWY63_02486 [Chloroflexi bacterium ADurb.Bin360]|nr:MAG: hypothetical protein BWY63_02486 [Chloroflexi bacterium ADurb.Bin360]